jgi:DNA-binding IclR family transcriptional regulator
MPVKPTEAVIRAAALLRIMAERPDDDYTLAELARRVGVNKTTGLSLLLGLANVGWVTRHDPGPTYRLGPGLISLGTAASSSRGILDVARPELEALTAELGLTSTAAVLAGQDMIIQVVVGDPHPLGWTIHPGQRLPLRYPTGSLHMAWHDPVAIDAWLDTAMPPIVGDRRSHHETLAEVRRRRYSVIIVDPRHPELPGTGASTDDNPTRAARPVELHAEHVSGMETRGQTIQLMTIAAPVFDGSGAVVLSLSLCGLAYAVHSSQISALGARIRDAADNVTAAIGGVIPSDGDASERISADSDAPARAAQPRRKRRGDDSASHDAPRRGSSGAATRTAEHAAPADPRRPVTRGRTRPATP